MKKLVFLVAFSFVVNVALGTSFWGPTNNDWFESSNWTGGFPTTGVDSWINANAVIGSGSATTNWSKVGFAQDGSITVESGASLTVQGLRVGSADTQERNGIVTVAGSMTVGQEFIVGEWGSGSLTLNGNANGNASTLSLYLGTNAGSSGYLELNDNSYLSISWLSMEGTYWGYASDAIVQLNGGTLYIANTGGITIWNGLAGNQIVFNGGSMIMPGDWTGTAQWIYDNSARFAVGVGLTFSATYDAASDQTTVTTIPEPSAIALISLGLILIRKKKGA